MADAELSRAVQTIMRHGAAGMGQVVEEAERTGQFRALMSMVLSTERNREQGGGAYPDGDDRIDPAQPEAARGP